MLIFIKNIEVYSPEYKGKKNILILDDKIAYIGDDDIDLKLPFPVKVIDGSKYYAFPGFIDGHVHITGGGGEGGFATRTPEIVLSDIIKGGITTIVGCLGTDGVTRSMENLYAKAKALEEEGVSTYIYTGSYRVPTTTLTGSVMKDIMMIDKVIGVGEVALSDHRSSQPSIDEIKRLTADARVGGILSKKAGVVNIHLGDGDRMLGYLKEIVDTTEIPITQFWPTHINRNPSLFKEGIEYAKKGGFIDFTTSSDPVFWEEGEVKASRAIRICLEEGVGEENITLTSDGQGSLPQFNEKGEFVKLGIGRVTSLYKEVRDAVLEDKVPIDKALKCITKNPARILKLNNKGRVDVNMDADLVLVDKDSLEIETVIAMGKILMEDKNILFRGTFE
ncbi:MULTISPECIES: beta-aspartyl-peptidase [Caloramator]|uniref:Isoaspartyl dipeptidase n=1 Tax=Caloramator proteoclasticus DSM 10124 TaxID=1121262 RepID=A0A1M4WGM5_9CLOT|nr:MULTISPECIES: beta-aspartyl-peptidase [Caloramator]SHE80398.1 beta-aspartyl-dipeptidase (metallo-type) [Caloramator proteoclasticus DSM 10124]